MLTFFSDRFSQALYALKDNLRRTLLSILGIAVGIAAVMAVGAISKGGNYLIFSELETFGLNSLWVFRNHEDKDPHRMVREGTGIDNDDYHALSSGCCAAVRRISAMVRGSLGRRTMIQAINRYSNAYVQGVDVTLTTINNDVIVQGRSFRARDIASRRAVAILGPTATEDLFGAASPIGREFRIGSRKFTVIGVLEAKSRDFLASIGSVGGQDANNRILIPYTTFQQMLGHKQINFLQAEAVTQVQAGAAAEQIIAVLRRHNGRNYAYKSDTMATYITTTQRILDGVTMIGIIAASVSLLVGGMGIMNLMSTSVLERTREIGLRKAVGAREQDILLQFLLEAMVISTLGGIIGLTLGTGASIVLAEVTDFPLTPSFTVIVIALVVSVAVGIISGYLPARRAARLHPVEALRYE
jgi:ABC-type antimicrobial peptide transport system permease subunit